MRIIEEKDERGEISRRWAELDPVESDGTHWGRLVDLIISEKMIPGVHLRNGHTVYAHAGLTNFEVFVNEAKAAQAKLTSLMDEAHRIHTLLALWERATSQEERAQQW